MPKLKPEIVICTYRLKQGKERQFFKLLATHWATLQKLRLVNEQPHLVFRGKDESKKTFFVEIFAWKSARAVVIAHESPAVLALWEPMEQFCENRLGRPAMEFPHVEPVRVRSSDVSA